MKVGFIIDTSPTMLRCFSTPFPSPQFFHQARLMVEDLIKKTYPSRKFFLATSDAHHPIKSSWEHPKEHLFRQLEYFKHSKSETNLGGTIHSMLSVMNTYRFLNGADNPINGI
jgi:hypothetical protein